MQNTSPILRVLPILQFLLIISLCTFWILSLFHPHFGIDFEIVHWSSHRILLNLSPYGAQATQELQKTDINSIHLGTGSGYPFPFYVLLTPLAALPKSISLPLWIILCISSCISLFFISSRPWYSIFILILLFMPIHRLVLLSQPSLLFLGLSACIIVAIQKQKSIAVSILIVLLGLKPQAGLLFALYGAFWCLKNKPKSLIISFIFAITLLIISFILQPTWVKDWLDQITTYRSVAGVSAIWWALLFFLPALRYLPWYANIALFQVFLFPLTDPYSFSPLIFVWIGLGTWLACFGALLSWAIEILNLSPSVTNSINLIITPLCVACASYAYSKWRHPVLKE